MTIHSILFYSFAAVLLVSALRVITARNPVHAALFLVLAFVTAAGLWLMLKAEFLALTLILVYVGAVMVLFLFVVMMLDINFDKLREGFWKHLPVASTVAVVMVAQMSLLLWARMGLNQGMQEKAVAMATRAAPETAAVSNTRELGRVLYTDYLLPFELAAVVLLIAMIAAIALTHRARRGVKSQDVAAQVRVKAAERLKIVKMDADIETPAAPPGDAPPAGQGAPKASPR
jgi:NADH-quinone oxidoreductase subunit J